MRSGREYAALYDKEAGAWHIIARDPLDYAADYWFVYLRSASTRREEAEEIARKLGA